MFGPDHLAGLRPGSNHQPWAPAAAGAFGTLAGPGPGMDDERLFRMRVI
jgi:hypothetical protein